MNNFLVDLYYSIFPNKNKYLTYKIGKSNIILSAPHGGNIKPIDIPYRRYGNRSRDTYTLSLIQRIIELSSQEPSYIYSNIHRSRVDLNRDIKEAAQGNRKAEDIWYTWDYKLKQFRDLVSKTYGKGLYIDIHSHNNSNLFQIGYGLSVNDYLDLKGGWEAKKHSTLFPLATANFPEKRLLFGYNSIIDSLEANGYKVLVPENEETYLNGGRNIKQYSGIGIGAIQVECPISVLRYNLYRVAQVLTYSIELFAKKFI